MEIKPIRLEADYERALPRVEELRASPKGSPEGEDLDILVTLVEAYEKERYPIDYPDPIEAIKFRLEQKGKDLQSLIGVIGQRTRVYEVMRGDRPLSLTMIRNLHDKFGIPADVLIQPTQRKRKPGKLRGPVKTDRFGRSRTRRSA